MKGEQRGFGFHEAPRGVLSHWVVIRDGKIANYQAVVPSTWNAGPRDENDEMGPYEASLVGNPVANPELPLELWLELSGVIEAKLPELVDLAVNELTQLGYAPIKKGP
jgi:Ni,Fe-hydrogenase I large subunit